MTGLPMTVIGYAMWTAVGHDGPSSVAALRAGVSGAATGCLWDPASGELLNACRVASHQWWEGADFLVELALPVIADMALGPEVPLLINVAPPHRPGRDPHLERIVLDGLAARLPSGLPPGSAVSSGGRAAMPGLLSHAATMKEPLCLILGVESFLQQSLAERYMQQGRLLGPGNSSGFIPGEAAAAVLVARGRRPGLVLTGMGAGTEASGDGGSRQSPVTGTGLTDAMRMALAGAKRDFYDINVLMGDLNGEHFKFKELAFASMRLDRVPPEGRSRRPRGHVEHWNVVECTGEIGAALMPAAMGWAFEAGRSGYLPGRVVFCAGEDDGRRVAVVGEWQNG